MTACHNCRGRLQGNELFCPYCGAGQEKIKTAPAAAQANARDTAWTTAQATTPAASPDLPVEIKGFNWGAFFFSWIWGLAHKTYIALLILAIPFVAGMFAIIYPPLSLLLMGGGILGFLIYLGVKGNEFAWKNRQWESLEQFKSTQKTWAYWGLGLFILNILFLAMSI